MLVNALPTVVGLLWVHRLRMLTRQSGCNCKISVSNSTRLLGLVFHCSYLVNVIVKLNE